MADWNVTEVKGHLERLYSELDEINAEEMKKIEEVAKIRALHTAKLEEATVLSARLHQLREQRIARLQREIHAIRSMPGYAGNDTAVGNDQAVERIIEDDRGGVVAVSRGSDDGNGDEEMEDQNQEGNADDEDEDDEDDDDEDDEDDEDAEDEDEDDEHGDEDGGAAAEDDEEHDSETGHGGRLSSGSDDGGGEYPAYDDGNGSADSDAYRRPSLSSFYDPWD